MRFPALLLVSEFILVQLQSNSKAAEEKSCDFFQGRWGIESPPSNPLYNYTSCPFIQKEFNCQKNGRFDEVQLATPLLQLVKPLLTMLLPVHYHLPTLTLLVIDPYFVGLTFRLKPIPRTTNTQFTSILQNLIFDCDCFHCYTGFWFRWDSSPNRELIHQAIEAFDDHLNTGDQFNSGRTKRKDKLGRRRTEKSGKDAFAAGELLDYPPDNLQLSISTAETPQVLMTDALEEVDEAKPGVTGDESMAAAAAVVRTHKGLARKVLPDVMGIFSSRLWSLWSPNV